MTVVGLSQTRIDTGFDGLFADQARRSNAPGVLPVRQATVRYGYATLVRDLSARQELGWAARSAHAEWGRRTCTVCRRPLISRCSVIATPMSAAPASRVAPACRTTAVGDPLDTCGRVGRGHLGPRPPGVGAVRPADRSRRCDRRDASVAAPLGVVEPRGVDAPAVGVRALHAESRLREARAKRLLARPHRSRHRLGLRSQEALLTSAGLERDLGTSASVRVEGYYKRFDDLLVG